MHLLNFQAGLDCLPKRQGNSNMRGNPDTWHTSSRQSDAAAAGDQAAVHADLPDIRIGRGGRHRGDEHVCNRPSPLVPRCLHGRPRRSHRRPPRAAGLDRSIHQVRRTPLKPPAYRMRCPARFQRVPRCKRCMLFDTGVLPSCGGTGMAATSLRPAGLVWAALCWPEFRQEVRSVAAAPLAPSLFIAETGFLWQTSRPI